MSEVDSAILFGLGVGLALGYLDGAFVMTNRSVRVKLAGFAALTVGFVFGCWLVAHK